MFVKHDDSSKLINEEFKGTLYNKEEFISFIKFTIKTGCVI